MATIVFKSRLLIDHHSFEVNGLDYHTFQEYIQPFLKQ